jgi:hypothetical protein
MAMPLTKQIIDGEFDQQLDGKTGESMLGLGRRRVRVSDRPLFAERRTLRMVSGEGQRGGVQAEVADQGVKFVPAEKQFTDQRTGIPSLE